ncbi:MAG: hypothetical protein N2654_01550 [Deltaproteobacteria bacterium]|nr:hypothetical protein [Deltaproteobacteria bacterium]
MSETRSIETCRPLNQDVTFCQGRNLVDKQGCEGLRGRVSHPRIIFPPMINFFCEPPSQCHQTISGENPEKLAVLNRLFYLFERMLGILEGIVPWLKGKGGIGGNEGPGMSDPPTYRLPVEPPNSNYPLPVETQPSQPSTNQPDSLQAVVEGMLDKLLKAAKKKLKKKAFNKFKKLAKGVFKKVKDKIGDKIFEFYKKVKKIFSEKTFKKVMDIFFQTFLKRLPFKI